jgi:hypothetical protein
VFFDQEEKDALRIGAGLQVAALSILWLQLSSAFPDRIRPPLHDGIVALSDPARLAGELRESGFAGVEVHEVEGVWEGPVGTPKRASMRHAGILVGTAEQPQRADEIAAAPQTGKEYQIPTLLARRQRACRSSTPW